MARKALKVLAALLGAALVGVAVFAVNLIWFRPWSLNLFYEKVFLEFAVQNPELLSRIGFAEQFGYRRHNRHLDDASVEKTLRDAALWRRDLADLRAYGRAGQSPSQRLSTRILEWFLENQVEGERFAFHDYPVNQLFGVQSELPSPCTIVDPVDLPGTAFFLSRVVDRGTTRQTGEEIGEWLDARGIALHVGEVLFGNIWRS